jgi:hypothetical protein
LEYRTAKVHPDRAITDPTDRSMPPEMITKVIPIATIAVMDVCRPMLNRFGALRNTGSEVTRRSATVITTHNINSVEISPNALTN